MSELNYDSDVAIVPQLSSESANISSPVTLTSKPSTPKEFLQTSTHISSGMLQLIDEEKEFNSLMSTYMKDKWMLHDKGFDFNVVAVFGSQSTGKSTLLNCLFKTDFDVLRQGKRQQTTKGIWIDRARDTNILIMDVEGTDGRERGEDQDFERKSALFSLAIAQVVIVNMWEHMVGLYNGANMGLLKTVFEVNLLLFGRNRDAKTLLYFVIRDHVSSTPTQELGNIVRNDLQRIWNELSKPEDLANEKLSDYFDICFTSLPHKLLQQEKFDNDVKILWDDFSCPESDSFVFKPEYKRNVPADGFSRYLETVWEKIVTNKELDLPTQQELLSQYRCDEILQSVLIPFSQFVDNLLIDIRSGTIVKDLGTQMSQIRDKTSHSFSEQASRYHKNVYQKKKAQMLETVHGELRKLFVGQIRNAIETASSEYETKSLAILEDITFVETQNSDKDESTFNSKQSSDNNSLNFLSIIEKNKSNALEYIKNVVDFSNIDLADWPYNEELLNLNNKLDKITIELRGSTIQKIIEQLCNKHQDELGSLVSDILSTAPENLWECILGVYIDQLEPLYLDLELLINSMCSQGLQNSDCSDISDNQLNLKLEFDLVKMRTRQILFDMLVKLCKEELNDQMLLFKLRNKFEEKFKYTDKGVPKIWAAGDDIDTKFAFAKDESVKLLPLYAKIDFSSVSKNKKLSATIGQTDFFYPESPITIMTPLNLKKYRRLNKLDLIGTFKQREIQKRAAKEIDMLFLEAKRGIIVHQTQIPVWVYVLLCFLGWNEAMTVIFNPLYLFLFITVGTLVFMIHNLGLWGPVMAIFNTASANATQTLHTLAVQATHLTNPNKEGTENIELSQLTRDKNSSKLRKSKTSVETHNAKNSMGRSSSRYSTKTHGSDLSDGFSDSITHRRSNLDSNLSSSSDL
ncbi:hypothetical protein BB561_000390 [Smittium simulii]|uniref:GB1/RHD3-type G domain-containing protein n=1 Tax=Smittium simulii TaxID=133385 RepID=A0A2T9YZK4_9FUNG|nr:hypothetical protein BB561_000390 [Smittium simulii]